MSEINLNTLSKQFQGTLTEQLVSRHVSNSKNDKSVIYQGIYGTLEMLPFPIRTSTYDLIDKYNDPVRKSTLTKTDTSQTLAIITDEARNMFSSQELNDETLFNIFQAIILSYAYSKANKSSHDGRFVVRGKQPLVSNYNETLTTLVSILHPDDNEEARQQERIAHATFEATLSRNEIYLGIAKGLNKGIILTQYDINDAVCFPRRFLGKESTANLDGDTGRLIDHTIEQIFFLGFLSYLLIWNFPTREKIVELDLDAFYNKWAIHSLVADKRVKGFDRQTKGLFTAVFEHFYKNSIENISKDQLKLGAFTLGKSRSYFNFLFRSGMYLGVCLDFTSKGIDFAALGN